MSIGSISAKEAERLAQLFVGTEAELTLCDEVPGGLYLVRPVDAEFFFYVHRPHLPPRVGSSEVIAVDRRTGQVRGAGSIGE